MVCAPIEYVPDTFPSTGVCHWARCGPLISPSAPPSILTIHPPPTPYLSTPYRFTASMQSLNVKYVHAYGNGLKVGDSDVFTDDGE